MVKGEIVYGMMLVSRERCEWNKGDADRHRHRHQQLGKVRDRVCWQLDWW